MKTVIFIGQHKVGSSSLQRFLRRNYLALLKAGILYPSVESQGLSHNILTALGRARGAGPPGPDNISEPHNALAFRMLADAGGGKVPSYHPNLPHFSQMLWTMESQITAFEPRAMILCAEVFANFAAHDSAHGSARDGGLIGRLKTALEGHDVHIICTLRRPDEYLVSWHGQRLRFGHKIKPLRGKAYAGALPEYFSTIHFDYRLMLEGWIRAFPGAKISLREYGSVLKAGGLVKDFIARAGVGFPRALVPVRDSNRGFPRPLMEIARLAGQHLPAAEARALRAWLLQRPKWPGQPDNHEVEMFGAANRQELLARFAPVNRFLSRFCGPGADFFPDIAQMARPRPLPEAEAANRALVQLRSGLARQPLSDRIKDFLSEIEIS